VVAPSRLNDRKSPQGQSTLGIVLLSSNVGATDLEKVMAQVDNLKQIQSMKGLKKTEKFRHH